MTASLPGAAPVLLSVEPEDASAAAALARPAANPGLIRVPASIAARLPGGVVYMISVRRKLSQCGNLGASSSPIYVNGTAFSFLDGNLEHVPVRLVFDPPQYPAEHWDSRLILHGDIVLESNTRFGAYELSELTFDLSACSAGAPVSGCTVRIRTRGVIPDAGNRWHPPAGKNFGVLWHGGHPYLQTWLATSYELPKSMSPLQVSGLTLGVFGNAAVLAPRGPMANQSLHIDAIDSFVLPGNTTRLMMGHTRLRHQDGFHTLYGAIYLQHFVLTDPDFPFALQHISPPFCFPSGHYAHMCEDIQFVMQAMLTAADAPGGQPDVLFTYGINDCESAAVRVRVADLLAFTRGDVPRLQLSPTSARRRNHRRRRQRRRR